VNKNISLKPKPKPTLRLAFFLCKLKKFLMVSLFDNYLGEHICK
jgi:hypothetical protein